MNAPNRRPEAIHELVDEPRRLTASRLRIIGARALQSRPRLYRHFARIKPSRAELLATTDTDLVIEGAPRSANTFLVAAFRLFNPSRRVAHHLHNSCQVSLAARHGLPCVVLVREPLAACASVLVWSADRRPREVVRDWIRFYEQSLPHVDAFLTVSFEQATSAPGQVFAAVNDRFGTDLDTSYDPELHRALVFEEVERMGRRHDGAVYETRVARPSDSELKRRRRQEAESALIDEVPARLRERAEALYHRYREGVVMMPPGR